MFRTVLYNSMWKESICVQTNTMKSLYTSKLFCKKVQEIVSVGLKSANRDDWQDKYDIMLTNFWNTIKNHINVQIFNNITCSDFKKAQFWFLFLKSWHRSWVLSTIILII